MCLPELPFKDPRKARVGRFFGIGGGSGTHKAGSPTHQDIQIYGCVYVWTNVDNLCVYIYIYMYIYICIIRVEER